VLLRRVALSCIIIHGDVATLIGTFLRFRCLLAKRNHAITMLKVNVKFPSEAVIFTNILYLYYNSRDKA
jgi:hypothetical protein